MINTYTYLLSPPQYPLSSLTITPSAHLTIPLSPCDYHPPTISVIPLRWVTDCTYGPFPVLRTPSLPPSPAQHPPSSHVSGGPNRTSGGHGPSPTTGPGQRHSQCHPDDTPAFNPASTAFHDHPTADHWSTTTDTDGATAAANGGSTNHPASAATTTPTTTGQCNSPEGGTDTATYRAAAADYSNPTAANY